MPRPAFYRKTASQLLCSFTHPQHAESAIVLGLFFLEIEPTAVVLNAQPDMPGIKENLSLYPACMGVFDGIDNGFLSDPEKNAFCRFRQLPRRAGNLNLKWYSDGNRLGQLRKPDSEIPFALVAMAQIPYIPANFLEAAASQIVSLIQMLFGKLRRIEERLLAGLQLHRNSGESLSHGVVYLPRDPITFCRHGRKLGLYPVYARAVKTVGGT